MDGLGKVASMPELAWLIAGLIGSVLVLQSFALLFWLSLIPQGLSLAVGLCIVEPRIHKKTADHPFTQIKEALALFKTNVRLRRLSLARILGLGIGESSFKLQIAFYNTVLPVWASGLLISANFLISVISYRLSGKLIRLFNAINLLIYQEIYGKVLYTVALVWPSLLSPVLMALASVFYGAGEVAKSTLLQQEFGERQRATMASINALFGSALYAAFSVLLGVLADRLGSAKTLLIAQVCLLPVLWLYWIVFHHARHPRRHGSS